MSRRNIREVELGTREVFNIKDQYARDEIERLHKDRKWFYVVDSYGVGGVTDNPFPSRLKNNGFIVDELSVGMMSYGGNAVNVIPQLTQKLGSMSADAINSITDVVSTLGLNDTWDNYNIIALHGKVEQFISFVLQNFPNVERIHLAPIGNEFDKTSDDTQNQPNRMKLVQHVIKKCVSYSPKVLFVNNSQIAMNCPAYFMSDCVHPNDEGSTMLYNNFLNYMRCGEFPINTYSYLHPLDQFGWRYRAEYVGDSCSGEFQWDSDVVPFQVVGTSYFDLIFSGQVELPIMKKLQLNPSIILRSSETGFTRGTDGLIGLTPETPTHAQMLLSCHANTGGTEPETYDHVRFYQSFSYTI